MKLKKNLLVLAAGAVLSASAQTAPQLNANNIDSAASTSKPINA